MMYYILFIIFIYSIMIYFYCFNKVFYIVLYYLYKLYYLAVYEIIYINSIHDKNEFTTNVKLIN